MQIFAFFCGLKGNIFLKNIVSYALKFILNMHNMINKKLVLNKIIKGEIYYVWYCRNCWRLRCKKLFN